MLKICFAYLLVSANIRTCTLRVFMTLFLFIRFLYFKGSLTRDFSSSGFISRIGFPLAPEYPIGAHIRNLLLITTPAKKIPI